VWCQTYIVFVVVLRWLAHSKIEAGRSLGTRAIVEALTSSDGDLPKVIDGEFLEISSQSGHNFSDCSK
jgi:hypothetical protein